MTPSRVLLALGLTLALSASAQAQFIPYYGKNKVGYDSFAWRVYKSPHFEVYYYPEFEQHLERVASYAESAYQKVSTDLKHELSFPVPLVLYKTHSEFEQSNISPEFVPEAVLAFAEPSRNRMVLPIDEAPDRLQGLITHELTHIFEFDLIPRGLIARGVPLWVDEGLADYERGLWDPLDLMTIRDAAVTDQIPKLSRLQDFEGFSNPRVGYNLGHAAFEFIEARFGKEGIRQYLYTLRKNIVGGGIEDIYQQAFRMKPEEFDEVFDKWLKERFKPYRDKQRPSDYGKDLSPNQEKTSFTQVFGFAPAPSGEMVAALTANRADGKADVVLLSARDGSVIKNLTKGYPGAYENVTLDRDFVQGRSIGFDPRGDTVAFFARSGKGRSLILSSVLTGRILRKIPLDLDQAESPCLLPDGRHALFAALKEGVSDIFLLDLDSGAYRNLTFDPFADSNPQVSPDGSLVVYTRRISGHDKLWIFPLADPTRKTQLSFGTFDDTAPSFSADGRRIYYASNEDAEIFNVRSLDLQTGVIRQYTDVLGANLAPAPLKPRSGDKAAERIAFISYFKGQYHLQSIEGVDPIKEVDQDVQAGQAEIVDFVPDLEHHVVPENKRRKHAFEKLFLEGRPPINVGVTSGGDFFGGSQVALADVLGDNNFLITALSVAEFRTYQGDYFNLSKRLHWGASVFDTKRFFYASPYGLVSPVFSRQGAIATQQWTGATAVAEYPLDLFRRLDFSAGVVKVQEQLEDPVFEAEVQAQAQALGVPVFLNNGTLVPIGVSLIQETTRFREFGPLAGSTFALSAQFAPSLGGSLSRTTLQGDVRKYLRLGSTTTLLALRARGFKSFGDHPDIFYFGGNMELRGYPYLSLSGNEGFFANAELRVPLIDLMKTPLGILGPVRGTLYAGVGGTHYKGESFKFSSSDPKDLSYVACTDATNCIGESVSGFHLVDGRASYGFGLQFFFFGYPLHFDWSKLTDFKVSSPARFDFWVGFDF